jgi:hypothetical protein
MSGCRCVIAFEVKEPCNIKNGKCWTRPVPEWQDGPCPLRNCPDKLKEEAKKSKK